MPEYATRHQDLPMAHWLSLATYLLLMATLALTTFWPDPVDGASPLVILSVKLVPLLIFLPGLIRAKNTTYIWVCFVLMLYFIQLSVSAYLHEWPWHTTTVMGLTVVFFTTAMAKIRKDRNNPGLPLRR